VMAPSSFRFNKKPRSMKIIFRGDAMEYNDLVSRSPTRLRLRMVQFALQPTLQLGTL
jgi:hypothetical protein